MKRSGLSRTIVAIAMMLIGWLPSLAHDFEVDGVYYDKINSSKVEVTYKGNSNDSYSNEYAGDVVIPSSVNYEGITYRVTSIGNSAFRGCYSLTSIEIGNSVTSIGDYAFEDCTSLTSIQIPNSVTSIGDFAFSWCYSLTSIEIGNSVTSIGDRAFGDCLSLTSIEIPNSVTSIGDYAFSGCSGLTCIEIPNSVTSIGNSAFSGCSSLTSIEIPNSVTSIGNYAFSGCSSLTSIEIPNSVTSIGDYAFEDCTSLTSIEIGNSVTSIGNYAFRGCSSLTSIEIPNSVTSIGNSAFSGCTSLTSIEIPNSVTSIGEWAFCGCTSLTSIEIPNSVTSIGYGVFYYCSSLTSIQIPNSVISIGYEAFYGCSSLTKITCLATTPPTIKSNTFSNYSAELYVPIGCKSAYQSASYWKNFSNIIMVFEYGGLTYKVTVNGKELAVIASESGEYSGAVVIPSSVDYNGITYSVKSIGEGAFGGRSDLTSIEIPNSVTSIGYGSFSDCSSLTSIEIPNSVTSIGEWAFCGCTSLTSIVVDAGNTKYDSRNGCNAIIETASNTLIAGCQNTIIPNSVTSIGDEAFRGCTSLTSIEIPNSVTSIGYGVFLGCSSLTSIEIPNSVTSIGDGAFNNCTSLTSIEIPNSVTSIGACAFLGCSSLTSIEIPISITSIGNDAISGCSSLTNIEIPDSVTSIGGRAFSGCSSLTQITCLATTPPVIGSNTFTYYNADLYVPTGCKSAYESAEYWKNFNIKEIASNLEDYVASIVPEDGSEVSSLKDFTINFTTKIYGVQNSAKLYKGETLVAEKALENKMNVNTYSFSFDKEITEAGDYTLVFPEESFVFGQSMKGNSEWKFYFYLNLPDTPAEIDAAFTADPANNSTVTAIKEITLTFTDYSSIEVAEMDMMQGTNIPSAYMTDDLTGALMPVGYVFFEAGAASNSLRLYVDPNFNGGVDSYSMEGSYVIRIPAGVVKFTDGVSKEILLNYTVKAATPTIDLGDLVPGQTYTIDANTIVTGRYFAKYDGTITLTSSVDANTNFVPFTNNTYTEAIETVLDEAAKTKTFVFSAGNRGKTVYFKSEVSTTPYEVTFDYVRASNLEDYVASIVPEDGSVVSSLKDFTINFTTKIYGVQNSVKLYKGETLVAEKALGFKANVNTYSFSFDEEITEAGDYTLVFPEETFTCGSGMKGSSEWKFSYTIEAAAPAITATWSIAEGATLDDFESVSLTFEGVESAASKSMYPCVFYKVADDGSVALVQNYCSEGVMDASSFGKTITYSIDKECYVNLQKGNYRIVIPAGMVKFNGDKENLNTEEYVLNFYLNLPDAPAEIDAAFTADPANNSTVTAIKEITLTFTDYSSIEVAEMDMMQGTNIPSAYMTDDLTGALMPVGYVFFEAGAASNSLRLYVDPNFNGGVDSYSMEGSYVIRIPAGVVKFADGVSKEILLNYTVKAGEVSNLGTLPISITPTDGSTVEELKKIVFEFSAADYPNTMDYDKSKSPVLYNEAGEAVAIGHIGFADAATYMSLYVSFEAPITEEGVYTLEVPAGAMREFGWGIANPKLCPAMELSYNVMSVKAESIFLDKTEVDITIDETVTLIATVLPENATNKSVAWTSSNTSVARVDENGVVTAIGVGEAIITATTTDGSNLSASCKVTVYEEASANFLSGKTVNTYSGATERVSVEMTNEQAITAFQCDIYLPDGISVATIDGEYDINLSSRAKSSHSLSCVEQSDGSIRLLCYSMSLATFSGNEGELFDINFDISKEIEGNYQVLINNVVLTDKAQNEYKSSTTIDFNVKAYVPADVNNDGSINVTDVVATASYILGLDTKKFIFEAADMNKDGVINVTDIVGIASIILNGGSEGNVLAQRCAPNSSDVIKIEDFAVGKNQSQQVAIEMTNASDYSAFQMDIRLPKGMSIAECELASAATDHMVAYRELPDGAVRVLVYSLTCQTLPNSEEGIIRLRTTTDKRFEGGEIVVENILFADRGQNEYRLYDRVANVNLASGVSATDMDCVVYAENRSIVIISPCDQQATITSVEGVSRTYSLNEGRNEIAAPQSGVYIVTLADRTFKVMVK